MRSIHIAVRTLLIYLSLASALTWADTPATPEGTDRQCGGEPCAAVFRGLVAFFDRDLHGLEGNGRSCNDCHMITQQFRLTPAAAEARFQKLQYRRRYDRKADDPHPYVIGNDAVQRYITVARECARANLLRLK